MNIIISPSVRPRYKLFTTGADPSRTRLLTYHDIQAKLFNFKRFEHTLTFTGFLVNRIPTMAVYIRLLFLQGRFSLKNRT
jgi:hypothetical protein